MSNKEWDKWFKHAEEHFKNHEANMTDTKTTYELFRTQGRGFFEPINEIDIRQIISCNPEGTCLWVKTPDYYMEVDCPPDIT